MNVAPAGQNCGRADQIATRHRGDEPAGQGAHQGWQFVVFGQQRIGGLCIHAIAHQRDHICPCGVRHGRADDMQPIGDQRPFRFQHLQPKIIKVCAIQIDGARLIADQCFQIGTFRLIGGGRAPACQTVLQLDQPFIQTRLRQWRRQMRDRDRVGTALGQRGLGRIVGRIKIDIRHLADQAIRPILPAQTRLLTGHEFERAMHPEMQQRIGCEGMAEPLIELDKGMGRGKAPLEQKAHRVALIPEGGLDADKNIAKLRAKHEDAAPVRLMLTGGRPPDRLDFGQRRRLAHDGVGIDIGPDVGLLPVLGGIALQDQRTQIIDRSWQFERVAVCLHPGQGVEQAFENAQISRRAHRARVGGKAEKDDTDLLVGVCLAAQQCQTLCLFCKGRDAFVAGGHRLEGGVAFAHMRTALATVGPVATAEHGGVGRAVDLRQGDKHCRLDRTQPLRVRSPLTKGLKLQRLRGHIGHIKLFQQGDRRVAVVIGRATHQRKAGQGDHRVDPALKVILNRGGAIKTSGESGDGLDIASLERPDNRIVVGLVR